MQKTCTWTIERPDGEGVLIEPCGQRAVIEFSMKAKLMGRLHAQRYPRCKRHASARVIEWAKENGFDIKRLREDDAQHTEA